MRYATSFAGDPAATYRSIDLAGRTTVNDSHALVDMLYVECIHALRSAAWAIERGNHRVRSERVSRATAVLFALETGLDFDKGGDVARTLATLYSGLRNQVVQASIGSDPAPFRDAANSLEEVADAWTQLRAA